MFYVKVHKKFGREVIAICDENILGKSFDEKNMHFEVKEDFYKGEKRTGGQVKEILGGADNFNLIGKEIISIALEMNIISKENIIKIKGVPHAQGISL